MPINKYRTAFNREIARVAVLNYEKDRLKHIISRQNKIIKFQNLSIIGLVLFNLCYYTFSILNLKPF